MRRLMVLMILVIFGSACGPVVQRQAAGQGGSSSAFPTSSPSAASGSPEDALALIGRWFVDTAGEPPGTAIKFSDDAVVFLTCGVMDAAWKADGAQSLFVASISGGDQGCFEGGHDRTIPWLTGATSFQVRGVERLLLDDQGQTLAVLRPGAEPTVGPNRAGSYAAPPTISPSQRSVAMEPAALPPEAIAPTRQQLDRKWLPTGHDAGNGKAYVSFESSGAWDSSDGCNGQGGRFALGERGRLLATSGASTLVGCQNSPVGGWVSQAERAGIIGTDLAFFDASGHELGRVVPA